MTTKKQDDSATNVSDSGLPIKRRIKSARALRSIYNSYKDGRSAIALSYSQIQALFDGNPPIPPSEMTRRGLGWMANSDWGEFRSNIRQGANSLWRAMNVARPFLRMSLKDGVKRDPQNPQKNWGKIVSKKYTRFIRKWPGYNYAIRLRDSEMLKFGISGVYWPDENDWRSRPLRASNILFPPTTPSSHDMVRVILLRDEMDVGDIMAAVSDEDSAKDAGWNVQSVRRLLVDLFAKQNEVQDSMDRYTISSFESAQMAVKNKDWAYEYSFKGLRMIHALTVEADPELKSEDDDPYGDSRPVTHQIICEDDDDETRMLFERESRFASITRAIQLFTFDIGDGFLRGVKGLGRELFTASHVSNHLINDLLNGVKIASGLLVQADSGDAAGKSLLVRRGNMTMVSRDVTLQQQQMLPRLGEINAAKQLIDAVSNNNSGSYRGEDQSLDRYPGTAQEATIKANDRDSFRQDQHDWYYDQHECWHIETLRRLMAGGYPETAPGYTGWKLFRKTLRDAGVPEHMMKFDVWDIDVRRAIGAGSRSAAAQITNEMVAMKSSTSMTEAGRRNIDREWFEARVGDLEVDEYILNENTDLIPTVYHSMADGENVDMQQGFQRRVAVDDPHAIHLMQHIQFAGMLIGMIKQGGMDPVKGAAALLALIQHCSVHLQGLSLDRSRAAQINTYTAEVEKLIAEYKAIAATAQQQQQAQQQQRAQEQKDVEEARDVLAQRTVEIELGKGRMMADVELKKAEMLNESRMAKAETSTRAQIISLTANLEALVETTRTQIEVMLAKAEAEIATKRAKAAIEGE